MPRTNVNVFPHLRIKAWDGRLATLSKNYGPELVDLDAALTSEWGSDAMVTTYHIAGRAAATPRVLKGAAPALDAAGLYLEQHSAFIDVDLEGHRAWIDESESVQHISEVAATLMAADLTPTALYSTRHGYRIVYTLTAPLAVAKSKSFLGLLLATLTQHGIDADPTCDQWVRMYRLPRITRDAGGGVEQSFYLPLGGVLDPFRFGELVDEDDVEVASTDYGDAPTAPLDLKVEQKAGLAESLWALQGHAIPPDDEGHTYYPLRRALASTAARGRVTDPTHLLSLFWASIVATDDKRVPQDFWKLACWICARQAGAEVAESQGQAQPRDPESLPESRWVVLLEACTNGNDRAMLQKARDQERLHRSSSMSTSVTGRALRLLAGLNASPTEMFQALYPSTTVMTEPLPDTLWEMTIRIHAEHAESARATQAMQDTVKVYSTQEPFVLAESGGRNVWVRDLRPSNPRPYTVIPYTGLPSKFDEATRPYLTEVLREAVELFNGKGEQRGIGAVVHEYGKQLERPVRFTSNEGELGYSSQDGTLTMMAHRKVLVPGILHEDVAKWVKHLGGPESVRLKDWLSTAPLTSRPTACLLLSGEAAAGKTFLAECLSTIWGAVPVKYSAMSKSFCEEALDTPVILADEGIKVDKNDAHASQEFRELVANSSRRIDIKYRTPVSLHSCFRIIVTCNDPLQAIPFSEALGRQGIAAITQRIIHIPVGVAATRYLKQLGGRDYTEDNHWLRYPDGRPGKVAEYVMWLHENHKQVNKGTRLLVEGVMTSWHRAWVRNQGLKPDILEMAGNFCHSLTHGQPVGAVKFDEDKTHILVSAQAIIKSWKTLGRTSTCPKRSTITQTLEQLSDKGCRRVRFQGARVEAYDIPVSTLSAAGIYYPEED